MVERRDSSARMFWHRAETSRRVRSRVGRVDREREREARLEVKAVLRYSCSAWMRSSGSHFSAFLAFGLWSGTGERRYKERRADVVRALVSAVWAYVVVPVPDERLLMLNSRTICWDLESTALSAGFTSELCSVRTTSTLSKPYPSSLSPFFPNSSRSCNNVFEHRTNAL